MRSYSLSEGCLLCYEACMLAFSLYKMAGRGVSTSAPAHAAGFMLMLDDVCTG